MTDMDKALDRLYKEAEENVDSNIETLIEFHSGEVIRLRSLQLIVQRERDRLDDIEARLDVIEGKDTIPDE